MIKEIIIFLVCEFILATTIAFIIRGSLNVRRFWIYFDEALGFIFIFGVLAFLWKFSTFSFIDQLFEFVFAFFLLSIALIVFIFVIGIELGNFLESIFRKKRR